MMTLTHQLLVVAKAYAAAVGIDLSRVSWRAFSESKTLSDLDAGRTSPTLRRADRALQWFSDHWPASAVWPEGVPRPETPAPEPAGSQFDAGTPSDAAHCPDPDGSGPFAQTEAAGAA